MIHPMAVVDSKAEIAEDVSTGPYCVIGPEVRIDSGGILHSHVVIQGHTTIGKNNQIYPFTVIGTPSQDLKDRGGERRIEIGSDNIIREHVRIHLPNSEKENTRIGNHNFLMGGVHVAHNCRIGDHVVIIQGTVLGGHVEVENHAMIGGQVAVHQYARIGQYAMVGGKAGVVQDIPPYTIVMGVPALFTGINRVGLERASFAPDAIERLTKAFEILYDNNSSLEEAARRSEAEIQKGEEIIHLVRFLQTSKRGICSR